MKSQFNLSVEDVDLFNQENRTIPFIVLTGLFFLWGFIISMNDILIPYMKNVFELSFFQVMDLSLIGIIYILYRQQN